MAKTKASWRERELDALRQGILSAFEMFPVDSVRQELEKYRSSSSFQFSENAIASDLAQLMQDWSQVSLDFRSVSLEAYEQLGNEARLRLQEKQLARELELIQSYVNQSTSKQIAELNDIQNNHYLDAIEEMNSEAQKLVDLLSDSRWKSGGGKDDLEKEGSA
jgi:hypothetical protein